MRHSGLFLLLSAFQGCWGYQTPFQAPSTGQLTFQQHTLWPVDGAPKVPADRGAYYVDAADMTGDGFADLVTLSLSGPVALFINPGRLSAAADNAWERIEVGHLEGAVALELIDVDRDGWLDIVVAHDFGQCPQNCTAATGYMGWLRSPGAQTGNLPWEYFPIGRSQTGIHRVRTFTPACDEDEDLFCPSYVLAIPIIGPGGNPKQVYNNSAVELAAFPIPKSPTASKAPWSGRFVIDDELLLVHGARMVRMPWTECTGEDSRSEGGRDFLMVAAANGVVLVDPLAPKGNNKVVLVKGEAVDDSPFYGVSEAVLRTTESTTHTPECPSYSVVVVSPWHGNRVISYNLTFETPESAPDARGPHLPFHVRQQPRSQVKFDRFGLHDMQVADLTNSGLTDHVIVAHRGPAGPDQGLWIFSPNDWNAQHVFDGSVSTFVVSDLNNDGILDIAAIGWGEANDDRVTVLIAK